MYALINMMGQIQNDSIGTVISLHRSVDTAIAAENKFLRTVKRNNGENSYIPTAVVKLSQKYKKGQHVWPGHAARVA